MTPSKRASTKLDEILENILPEGIVVDADKEMPEIKYEATEVLKHLRKVKLAEAKTAILQLFRESLPTEAELRGVITHHYGKSEGMLGYVAEQVHKYLKSNLGVSDKGSEWSAG